ncbi:MAG TPA: DUF4430 domain-containing protein [Bacillota bacterium]|nr:DUF4430 domain-containing protein [Bacillota bacterium]
MNKWLLRLLTMLLVIGLVTGCSVNQDEQQETNKPGEQSERTEQNQSSTEAEETVVITISKDEGEKIIAEQEIAIEADAILMDVLKDSFEIEEEGGFITSIEGVAPEDDEEKAWMYFVNGEMASVGAEEFELHPGDEVTFDLQAWE